MTVFHDLNNRANKQIEDLLEKLNIEDCEKLLNGIRTVKDILPKQLRILKFVHMKNEIFLM